LGSVPCAPSTTPKAYPVIAEMSFGRLAEVIGMLETNVGSGTDVAPRKNQSFAWHRHVHSLELTWLFADVTS
jgi:hypothetical protein